MTRHAAAVAAIAATLLLAATAGAAEQTETPPWLRGDAWLGYQGEVQTARLVDRLHIGEAYTEVARSLRQRHGLLLGGRFAVYHGISVGLDVPIVVHDRLVWGSANDMRWDPEAGRPTMIDGSRLSSEIRSSSASSRRHTGLGDMVLRIRAVPFAQSGVPGREAPASMSVDLDVRMPTGGDHDTVRDNGTAGPGIGGPGLGVTIAASRRVGSVEPWLSLAWHLNGPYKTVLVDADGRVIAPLEGDPENRSKLDPADSVSVRLGTEIHASEDPTIGQSVRIDVGAGLTYIGPSEISSGTNLPAPLDPTIGSIAIDAEHLQIDVDLGVRVRPRAPFELRIDFGASWLSPHTVERVSETAYGITTGTDTFLLRWGVSGRARFR